MGIHIKPSAASPVAEEAQDIQFTVVTDPSPNASLFTFDSITNVLTLSAGAAEQLQLHECESTIEMGQIASPNSDFTGSVTDGEMTPCSSVSGQDSEYDPNNLTLDKDGQVFDFDLLSVIKEELKWKIQSQRLAKGQEVLTVEERKIQEDKLTEEEEAKRADRRRRNKIAAAKCRTKKRDRSKILSEKIDELDEQQKRLKVDLSTLRSEKEHLMSLLQDHIPSCTVQTQDGTLVLCNTVPSD
ncbi:cyclic AMP-dependent transcription factor ATF-3-like [Anneissia japonica]|uniref:cyclic AMP-dependent transcription factor ATF-3-like n=1 Tax=Anneissia japonica TaxID=1529436 RepID=UPI001425A720|nr:cyclic AMP-dependent transcription factor ATF-3-like [Anneissia japonica]